MKAHTDSFQVSTRGKGTYEITGEVERIVRASGVKTGTVTVFVQHTSASLIIYENAGPSARTALHAFFERLVPEDQDYFVHTDEGPDDMPSHLQMTLHETNHKGVARLTVRQLFAPSADGTRPSRRPVEQ